MNQFLKGALIANAAAMGFNWVYNIPYLERLAKQEDLLFQKADEAKYKRARKAVLAYPYAEIGDVSLQGEIAKWLYEALKNNPELTKEDYEEIVYEKIKPGGFYRGWIESYGRKLVFNRLHKEIDEESEALSIQDDQLIGFVPYIVCKALDLPNEKAWELAQAFTDNEDYKDFYKVFDGIIQNLGQHSLKEALQLSLQEVPKHYGFKLTMAISMDSVKDFVLQLVNTSCSIKYAIPLIYAILSHTDNYEEAVRLNTLLGGASSDRAMLIGALYSLTSEIPKEWQDIVKT